MSPPAGAREAANALSIKPPRTPPRLHQPPTWTLDKPWPRRLPTWPRRHGSRQVFQTARLPPKASRTSTCASSSTATRDCPPDADTASLRDAFRSPPRSGGKVFQPFTIFGLVTRFYAREIKTWTELARLLGVEPPDLAKDESAQKVAQYGVRLKKWMNSMHVRAFFEYLLGIPNDYWTSVPSDPSPIACPIRDGVAVEDDAVLRALIPHIRPKRGRRRPDVDEHLAFPAQKLRVSDPSSTTTADDQSLSAHSSGDGPMQTVDVDPDGVVWRHSDALQTPLGRWPQSAVTPSSKGTLWDHSLEPRSAVTPSRPKTSSHRRGAKNVSSAWNPVGSHAGAKQRGRPPVNRTPIDGPSLASQTWKPTQDIEASPSGSPSVVRQGQDHCQHQPQVKDQAARHLQGSHQGSGRPSRPSISLQVPERQGGAVRLATPPSPPRHPEAATHVQNRGDALVAPRGPQQDAAHTRETSDNGWQRFAKEATDAYEQASKVPSDGCQGPENMPEYYFEKMEDRTNVDALVSYFVRSMSDSEWVDLEGKPYEPASVEESTALVNAMLQNMYKTSTSPQAFLINLAALAGSMTLVTSRPKCVRMGQSDDSYVYRCDWEYRFGHVKCGFTMPQYVPCSMWKKAEAGPPDGQQEQTPLTDEDWKRKYLALAEEMHKRNTELADLRAKVMTSLGREWTKS